MSFEGIEYSIEKGDMKKPLEKVLIYGKINENCSDCGFNEEAIFFMGTVSFSRGLEIN